MAPLGSDCEIETAAAADRRRPLATAGPRMVRGTHKHPHEWRHVVGVVLVLEAAQQESDLEVAHVGTSYVAVEVVTEIRKDAKIVRSGEGNKYWKGQSHRRCRGFYNRSRRSRWGAATNIRQRTHLLAGYRLAPPPECPLDTPQRRARSLSQQYVSGLLHNEKTFEILRNSCSTAKVAQLGFKTHFFFYTSAGIFPARNRTRLYRNSAD